jgi:protoporphyrinogen oxidase
MTRKPSRWAVVGGGVLGMMLAHRLSQQGKQVTLFEAAGQLGGLASAWELGDVVWDRHYHVILLSDTHLRDLLGELGLEDDLVWKETRTGFYTDGQLYSMSNTLEFLRFPPLGLIDKLRLGLTIFYASKIRNWKRLEKVSVENWLRRWSGRRTFEKIWLPLLRAKLGENYRQASAAFIWAIIARMYAARRTGLKKEMFGYVRGGYARILERFVDLLERDGVEFRLGTRVEKIAREDGQTVVRTADGRQEAFEGVVVTSPAPIAERICPGLSADEKDRLRGIQYQGIICASLLLKQPLAGYYVTNITDPWVPFTAVIETSALVNREEFGGHCLVYLPKYVTPDDPAFGWSDDEVREKFLAALERMVPHVHRDEVLAFRVSRVKHVLAISTLNYSERLPPLVTSVPGLYVINSAHIVNGTLNVNETLALAERAVGLLNVGQASSLPDGGRVEACPTSGGLS